MTPAAATTDPLARTAACLNLTGRVQGGKLQAVGALIGQAKRRNPNVNPGRVREICIELIGKT